MHKPLALTWCRALLLLLVFPLSLAGCSSKLDVSILGIVNQSPAVVEQKFGKPTPVSGDNQLQSFPTPSGIKSLYILFSPEGKATKVIVEFDTKCGTSLQALERVGLGENGISRGTTTREGEGWTYLDQDFSGVHFSKVKTIGGTGNYQAVAAEL